MWNVENLGLAWVIYKRDEQSRNRKPKGGGVEPGRENAFLEFEDIGGEWEDVIRSAGKERASMTALKRKHFLFFFFFLVYFSIY